MKPDKVAAAHEAFAAYEKAIVAAQEALADGPPKGLGTTVMTEIESGWPTGRYTCSECGKEERAGGWKFCPHCGSEIMRFDKTRGDEDAKQIAVLLEKPEEPQEPHVVCVTVENNGA